MRLTPEQERVEREAFEKRGSSLIHPLDAWLARAEIAAAERELLQEVVDWNTKYPNTRWYSQSECIRMGKELDVICDKIRTILAPRARRSR